MWLVSYESIRPTSSNAQKWTFNCFDSSTSIVLILQQLICRGIKTTTVRFRVLKVSIIDTCHTNHVSHQPRVTPTTCHTNHVSHQPRVTPTACHTNHVSHQPRVTPTTCHTNHVSHQPRVTPTACHTNRVSHQPRVTPTACHTNHVPHQPRVTPTTCHTNHVSHQPRVTPTAWCKMNFYCFHSSTTVCNKYSYRSYYKFKKTTVMKL